MWSPRHLSASPSLTSAALRVGCLRAAVRWVSPVSHSRRPRARPSAPRVGCARRLPVPRRPPVPARRGRVPGRGASHVSPGGGLLLWRQVGVIAASLLLLLLLLRVEPGPLRVDLLLRALDLARSSPSHSIPFRRSGMVIHEPHAHER